MAATTRWCRFRKARTWTARCARRENPSALSDWTARITGCRVRRPASRCSRRRWLSSQPTIPRTSSNQRRQRLGIVRRQFVQLAGAHLVRPVGIDDERAPDGDEIEIAAVHHLDQPLDARYFRGGLAEGGDEVGIEADRADRDGRAAGNLLRPAG